MQIDEKVLWSGVIEDQHGLFKARFIRRAAAHAEEGLPEWILMGEHGKCGEVQGYAEGCRKWTRFHYQDSGLPVPPPPGEFAFKVLERFEARPAPVYGEWVPVAVPVTVRFWGVCWIRTGCTTNDYLCSGKAEFNADGFEVAIEEESCDAPLLVGNRST